MLLSTIIDASPYNRSSYQKITYNSLCVSVHSGGITIFLIMRFWLSLQITLIHSNSLYTSYRVLFHLVHFLTTMSLFLCHCNTLVYIHARTLTTMSCWRTQFHNNIVTHLFTISQENNYMYYITVADKQSDLVVFWQSFCNIHLHVKVNVHYLFFFSADKFLQTGFVCILQYL